jgi:hypothetical protein
MTNRVPVSADRAELPAHGNVTEERGDVLGQVGPRGIGTPLAVSEWRRLPTKVRRLIRTGPSAAVTRHGERRVDLDHLGPGQGCRAKLRDEGRAEVPVIWSATAYRRPL